MRRGCGRERASRPGANLEIDLGLDSLDRVELVAELEHRFGVQVSATRIRDLHRPPAC